MKRVMIVGGPGSGKSTFALALAESTDLPVFHMDHIHYAPGWNERPLAEKILMAKAIEAKPRWIFEGGLSSTYANRSARADTVIWLDLPVMLRLGRIIKRRVQFHNQSRPDMAYGCIETLAPDFLAFVIRTRHSAREKIAQTIADAPHLKTHHVRTAKGADILLEWLRDDHQSND